MAGETPITTLMNFCAANRIPSPNFILVHDGSACRNQMFFYEVRLTVNETEVRAYGTGTSKQRAKHDSAMWALDKISDMNLPQSPVTRYPISIRKLHQFCEKNGLPRPEYSLVGETGARHCKQFTIECSVSTWRDTATSSSKKAAKHLSSERVFNLLQTVDLGEHFG